MKHIISVMSVGFILVITLSSCTKVDWNLLKDKQGEKFLVPDCDVKRVYTVSEGGSTKVQMQKTYYPTGRVKKIAFYTYSGTSEDVFWHSFLLDYDLFNRTVNITDSTTGSVVLKAFFNRTGKLERLEKLGFDNSPSFLPLNTQPNGSKRFNLLNHSRTIQMETWCGGKSVCRRRRFITTVPQRPIKNNFIFLNITT